MRLINWVLPAAYLMAIPIYAAPCTSAPLNLVANCGFETGTFTGWTLSGYDSAPGYNGIDYGVDAFDAHSGAYGAYLGGFGGVLNLSQSIVITPGVSYDIGFWLAQSPAPVAPYLNSFSASFGSSSLISLSQVPNLPFTEYSFDVSASSPISLLNFGFRDDTGFFSIDDITVTPALVPEPMVGGLVMLGTLLLILTGWAAPTLRILFSKVKRQGSGNHYQVTAEPPKSFEKRFKRQCRLQQLPKPQ